MTTWLDWPDSPGFWWIRRNGVDVVCECCGHSLRVTCRGDCIARKDCPARTTFQKVQPPDADPPDWYDRPTCAGRWIIEVHRSGTHHADIVKLTAADVSTIKPDGCIRYFGPIPAAEMMSAESCENFVRNAAAKTSL